jgi:benzoylformate decarboxylase/acetolactate synthase-1/2/3 large subunit
VSAATGQAPPEYGSDLLVDQLAREGIRYVALNPGSTFRGLHDSLVNRDGPQIILCPSENVAVGLAHGYAKATGELLAVAVHDVVGLLRGALGVYWAYLDRVPMLLLGGAGPFQADERRGYIDWIHAANVQGGAVRDYTKWDEQPYSLPHLLDATARACRIATGQPQGPVYVTVDVGLQLQRLDGDAPPVPEPLARPTPAAGEPEAIREAARLLLAARQPVAIAGYAGRDPRTFDALPALAELVGLGVWDTNVRLNAPNRHPHNVTGHASVADADLWLLLDVKDVADTAFMDAQRGYLSPLEPPAGVTLVDIGFNDVGISSWAQDAGALTRPHLQITADTSVALPQLLGACRALLAEDPALAAAVERRTARFRDLHAELRARWDAERDVAPPGGGLTLEVVAAQVWDVVRDEDWVLSAGTAKDRALRTWDFDAAHRHPGKALATATQISIALGVALAHRGSGRIVVDLQPDGDLLFEPAALWVAAAESLPLLVVVLNNRAYWTDWAHQERVADERGRPRERASVGMSLADPAVDFAGLATSFGWHAEGPVTGPGELRGAVERAVAAVRDGTPALVDVVCARQ